MIWPTRSLGVFCRLVNGKAFKSDDWSAYGWPIIRIQNLNDPKKPFNHWNGGLERQVPVQPGDLLIAWSGTPGTSFGAHIWGGPAGVLNQHIFRADLLDDRVTKDWLKFCINIQLMGLIDQAHGGVGLKHVTKGAVESVLIPLPTLAEQKRIARILDAADALRAKRREALAQLDTLLQSIFLDMFGDPVTNPKGWEMGVVGDLLASATYGTSKKAVEGKGQYPVLRMNNITYSGEWDFRSLKFVDLEDKELSKHLVRRGQILFNRTNSKELVGKTAVYRRNEPMAFAGYLVRGVVNDLADPEYIGSFMNTPQMKTYLRNRCKSIVGMANINAKEFQAIPIPKPPLMLQRRFATIVESVERQKARMRAHLAELDALFASLQSRAFSGTL